jgi:hypothetical protein
MTFYERAGKTTALAVLAVVAMASGWAMFATQWRRGEQLQGQLVRMQLTQAAWRHKAGRAYTALLKSQGGAEAGVIVLPEGATMDCVEAPGGGKHCDPTLIFPPDSY